MLSLSGFMCLLKELEKHEATRNVILKFAEIFQ